MKWGVVRTRQQKQRAKLDYTEIPVWVNAPALPTFMKTTRHMLNHSKPVTIIPYLQTQTLFISAVQVEDDVAALRWRKVIGLPDSGLPRA
jgi:hypothetical protein